MMDPRIIINLLDASNRDETDGPRSQAMVDAIEYIRWSEHEVQRLRTESEDLHAKLNVETARRFVADQSPTPASVDEDLLAALVSCVTEIKKYHGDFSAQIFVAAERAISRAHAAKEES